MVKCYQEIHRTCSNIDTFFHATKLSSSIHGTPWNGHSIQINSVGLTTDEINFIRSLAKANKVFLSTQPQKGQIILILIFS